MFKSAAKSAFDEIEDRRGILSRVMKFGIDSLDDSLRGIICDDMILLGAPSGVGKTALCCHIALTNILAGNRVHYIALEAAEHEIERRLKYPMIAKEFFNSIIRPNIVLNFADWIMGKFVNELYEIEHRVATEFEEKYKNLFLFYKQQSFGLAQLIESVSYAAGETDLILIDHVHYFDLDDDNENRAMKEIAKTIRTLVLEKRKPIILVAHLRKRDRNNDDLIAGLDEFHGSSDLTKIATKVVTMSPGNWVSETQAYETFFRTPKNRWDSGVIRYSYKEFYDPKTGEYLNGRYEIGSAMQSRSKGFEQIPRWERPQWASEGCGDRNTNAQRQPTVFDRGREREVLPNFAEQVFGSGKENGMGRSAVPNDNPFSQEVPF